MTNTTPPDHPKTWTFAPAEDRSQTVTRRTGTQLNADEFRNVLGYRLDRADHVGEPTQVWKHGALKSVLVSPTWFEQANALMRDAGFDHASEDFKPLPARSDSSQ